MVSKGVLVHGHFNSKSMLIKSASSRSRAPIQAGLEFFLSYHGFRVWIRVPSFVSSPEKSKRSDLCSRMRRARPSTNGILPYRCTLRCMQSLLQLCGLSLCFYRSSSLLQTSVPWLQVCLILRHFHSIETHYLQGSSTTVLFLILVCAMFADGPLAAGRTFLVFCACFVTKIPYET